MVAGFYFSRPFPRGLTDGSLWTSKRRDATFSPLVLVAAASLFSPSYPLKAVWFPFSPFFPLCWRSPGMIEFSGVSELPPFFPFFLLGRYSEAIHCGSLSPFLFFPFRRAVCTRKKHRYHFFFPSICRKEGHPWRQKKAALLFFFFLSPPFLSGR